MGAAIASLGAAASSFAQSVELAADPSDASARATRSRTDRASALWPSVLRAQKGDDAGWVVTQLAFESPPEQVRNVRIRRVFIASQQTVQDRQRRRSNSSAGSSKRAGSGPMGPSRPRRRRRALPEAVCSCDDHHRAGGSSSA